MPSHICNNVRLILRKMQMKNIITVQIIHCLLDSIHKHTHTHIMYMYVCIYIYIANIEQTRHVGILGGGLGADTRLTLIRWLVDLCTSMSTHNKAIKTISHRYKSKGTQVNSAQSSLVVTHPSTNQGQHAVTSVNMPGSVRGCGLASVNDRLNNHYRADTVLK